MMSNVTTCLSTRKKNVAIAAPGGSERFNSGALAIVAGGETRNGAGRRLRSRGHQVILRWARRTLTPANAIGCFWRNNIAP
jgi:hypothetical protein